MDPSGTGWASGKSSTPGGNSILSHVPAPGSAKV
jgi:hypothetical protein